MATIYPFPFWLKILSGYYTPEACEQLCVSMYRDIFEIVKCFENCVRVSLGLPKKDEVRVYGENTITAEVYQFVAPMDLKAIFVGTKFVRVLEERIQVYDTISGVPAGVWITLPVVIVYQSLELINVKLVELQMPEPITITYRAVRLEHAESVEMQAPERLTELYSDLQLANVEQVMMETIQAQLILPIGAQLSNVKQVEMEVSEPKSTSYSSLQLSNIKQIAMQMQEPRTVNYVNLSLLVSQAQVTIG